MRGWRAWTADGLEWDSASISWGELPEGVVGVVEYREPPYRRIHDGHDWIWLEDGAFHVVDTHPRWGRWAPQPRVACAACLKRGAPMPDDEWRKVQRKMMAARTPPRVAA